MPKFGQTAAEYESNRSENDGEVWLKGFKEGETRVRFLQPTHVWPTAREHYSEGPGYFPCSEESDCPGCTDPSKRVQNRSRKYFVNTLDERGRVSVHKMGSRLYKTVKSREQRTGTILDRDYTIIRTGKTMDDTVYELEAGERYEIDGEVELHDIPALLEAKYNEACEAYGITPPPPSRDPEVGVREVDPDEALTQQVLANTRKAEAERAVEASLGDTSGPAMGTSKDPDQWGTDDLRQYLTENKVEFPPKAPRSKLVGLVASHQDANPGF